MEQPCQKLRLELKEWEKAFATANGGKKAGREDIKQHPDIGTLTPTHFRFNVVDRYLLSKQVQTVQ